MPWTTVEIGDLDVFSPTLPSLVVYTWYVEDEPESSIAHFWRDEDSGIVQNELLFIGPVAFETAVEHAKKKAPERNVERIHVRHSRRAGKPAAAASPAARAKPAAKAKPASKAKAKPIAKTAAEKPKKATPVKKASR